MYLARSGGVEPPKACFCVMFSILPAHPFSGTMLLKRRPPLCVTHDGQPDHVIELNNIMQRGAGESNPLRMCESCSPLIRFQALCSSKGGRRYASRTTAA